ncbi:MAG TPA: adenosylcobinamide-phosphate synthase CbiB [Acetobacteraceae bacterium]|nr:adenosylcobinamide-phosphate synthase CbiB [Acetobacteraceae bacterium]
MPPHTLPALAAALALEAAFGYPDTLYRAIRHPVVWIGALIAALDRSLNRDTLPSRQRRINGVLALVLIIAAAALPAWLLQHTLGPAAIAIGAATLLAQRSLWQHVAAVADGLERDGLDGGRRAVASIVGRNPLTLDEAGVARAAIESLAENFSDGVVAPALWCALLGLPGIAAYKAINTADSMIGHRSPRHAAFGWAAARLDDLVNLPASRLAALFLILVQPNRRDALRSTLRDAPHHRSPNAGWPEAAMAGALGLRLAGPRVYGTTRVDDSWMGDGRAEAAAADIRRALAIYRRACLLQGAMILGLAIALG